MSRSTSHITSAVLLLTFSLSLVGVPVVRYLCPMMSAENPTCAMSPAATLNASSFANQLPSCCAKFIVAERNTTPFLKADQSASFDLSFILNLGQSVDLEPGIESFLLTTPGSTAAEASPPDLVVLHSSLLI